MRLIVDLEEDGPVTPEIVRQSVEYAIRNWNGHTGLSDGEDEGLINSIDVQVLGADACLLVHGGPVEGFTHVGPFTLADDARSYAEREGLDDSWWVVPLHSVESEGKS